MLSLVLDSELQYVLSRITTPLIDLLIFFCLLWTRAALQRRRDALEQPALLNAWASHLERAFDHRHLNVIVEGGIRVEGW